MNKHIRTLQLINLKDLMFSFVLLPSDNGRNEWKLLGPCDTKGNLKKTSHTTCNRYWRSFILLLILLD